MKVLLIEEPTELRNHLVWVVKDDDEDWGQLRDAVYHDQTFRPNRACVIVVQQKRHFHADWMQVREHHEGEGWAHCVGTAEFESGMPKWANDVADFAVNVVKEAN